MRSLTLSTFAAVAAALAPAAAGAQQAPPPVQSPAAAAYAARILSPAEAQADVALMRRALETIHPGLYRRTPKARIDAAFADLEAAMRAPISELELYRRISLLLAEIRCNHTKAEQNPALEKWRLDHPSHAPFRFRVIEGRMIVVSADPAQPGLARGDEIVAINGRSAKSVLRTLGAYAPIDGATVWSRATNLADDSDLMGSDFDHFYPYVFGFAESYRLTVKDAAGARRPVTVRPISFRAWRALPWDGIRYRSNFSDSVQWRMLDDATAYLRIDTFVNYRKPVDARALFDRVFSEIGRSGAQALVLDLRNNGGGSSDATHALADFLLDHPYVWNRAIALKTLRYGDLPDFIETWGDRTATFFPPLDVYDAGPTGAFETQPPESPDELLPRTPAPNAFKGRVTILTSPVNGSGSTMLIAKLRDEGRVRLVGERLGGSGDGPTAGRIFNVKLPNSGIAIRVPNAFNAMQVQRFDADGGVTPDVFAPLTIADFRAGRDTALQAALADRGAPRPASPAPDATPALAAMAGAWRGTLEYRDFQSDRRVTLPTDLTAKLEDRALSLAFTYDDGPGKIVRSASTITLDLADEILTRTRADGVDLYRIRLGDAADRTAPFTWTLWGRGTENGAPVDVRETLSVTPTAFSIVRETRATGGAYTFRNAYRLTRVGP